MLFNLGNSSFGGSADPGSTKCQHAFCETLADWLWTASLKRVNFIQASTTSPLLLCDDFIHHVLRTCDIGEQVGFDAVFVVELTVTRQATKV